MEYQAGLDLQQLAHQVVLTGACEGILILLEHAPVITVGRGGGRENICRSLQELHRAGIVVVDCDRGGNVTCHNPGQIVGYPVLNLGAWRRDVHWYVETLEEMLIRVLARFGLRAGRKARYTGVWLQDQKVAAIGVAVSHWVTRHGFALNVRNDLGLFQNIIPCGIGEFGVTSLEAAGAVAPLRVVYHAIMEEFFTAFDCEPVDMDSWRGGMPDAR